MGTAILFIVESLIQLAVFLVIANAIVSRLLAFGVLNIRNPAASQFVRALDAMTYPLLAPIRRFVPSLGGIDISPIILILLLQALNMVLEINVRYPLTRLLG
jgi:YggT family protein